MKAILIQQPWAYCITHGTKRVENRTWPCGYRGPILLHAGKRYQRGVEQLIHADSPEVDIAGMLAAPRGAIVGCAKLVACVRKNSDLPADQQVWADPEQWKFVLEDVIAFGVPTPWKGALGIFEVPIDPFVDKMWRERERSFQIGSRSDG